MYSENSILIGCNDEITVKLLPKLANRHGLIAGATGTGKTITIKTLAESFSDMGVPVFLADMKGDISGLSKSGQQSENVEKRVQKYSLQDKGFGYKAYPVEFWDLYGERGLPVRVTISEIGPILLSRILNLTEAQQAVLNVVFKVADEEALLLIDIKDLKSMINYVVENKDKYAPIYGEIPTRSANTILRSLLTLEDQGADNFFGEQSLELNDLMQCDDDGKGIINILDSVKLSLAPELYSTFLLWMLSKLYETLPEVGDMDKPKFVFFFDEAHLLFDNMNPTFLQKIEQIIRLIRSKGVGLYFISQSPSDIPDSVLSQLGNRIQHALRAYTPKDQKAVKTAAETFRPNDAFDTKEVISNLAIGEALVSMLDETGVPEVVQKVDILPPQSYIGAIDDEYRSQIVSISVFKDKYFQAYDRESAYELLVKKVEEDPQQPNIQFNNQQSSNPLDYATPAANQTPQTQEDMQYDNQEASSPFDFGKITKQTQNRQSSQNQPRQTQQKSEFEKIATNVAQTVAREATRQITRGLFGNMKLW